MKKLLLLVAPIFISLVIFAAVTYFLNKDPGKGALQVTSMPESEVYLDGKLVGKTPLCIGEEQCEIKDMIEVGSHAVKLVPKNSSYSPYEARISINKLTLTVVDRTFREQGSSSGSIITLTPISSKKNAQLFILSFPDKAKVFLDNNYAGATPFLLENLTESDHDLGIAKEGYLDKFVKIRTIFGYKLEAVVSLGVDRSASPSSDLENDLEDEEEASPSAALSLAKIVILNTPTGFLRVRTASSTASLEIDRVTPGEAYEMLSEGNGWFEIKLEGGKTGWVSGQYAKKE